MYNIITNKRKPNNLELEGINLEEEFKSKGIITLYNKVQLIFVLLHSKLNLQQMQML